MNLAKFTLIASTLLLANCKTKQEEKAQEYFAKQRQSILTGRWIYNNTVWYKSELYLDKEGNFTFYNQTCTGKIYTHGKWLRQGEFIILSSSETYKSPNNSVAVRSNTDTTYIFLNNEKFLLENDTLRFIGQNRILDGHNFYRPDILTLVRKTSS